MRRYFWIIFVCVLSHFGLLGQHIGCGSSFDSDQLEHFLSVKKDLKNSGLRSEEVTYIPVKFHLVATAEEAGRLRFENALDQLCELNANFADQNIQFYLKDGDVNEVNDNTIYNNPASAAGATKMAQVKSEFGKNAVNVFFTDQAQTGSDGITLGYYTFNQDLVVIKKTAVQDANQIKFVLGHELGHFFSLPHTFLGWDQVPWDGIAVTSATSPGGQLNELADGSNCENAGDMICDTPADYNLGFGWDGCRIYDGGCTDPNGELLDPDETNFMGYFIDCNEYQFSDDQQAIIRNDYESARRSYLRVSYTPNVEPITEIPELIGPEDGSISPFYNGVELSWTEVPNASHYLLELTQGLFKSFYKVEQNKIFFTDLDQEKLYRWKVKPYNELSTCSSYSQSYQFTTGNMTSSTKNIDSESKLITVFPNPGKGSQLNISFSDELKGNFNVSLLDISGKLLYTQEVRSEEYTLDHLQLKSGFYILNVKQGDINITKKVIVNE